MEDGRKNLLVRGARPFRVLERAGRLAYPVGPSKWRRVSRSI
jgi:hypothetical protein